MSIEVATEVATAVMDNTPSMFEDACDFVTENWTPIAIGAGAAVVVYATVKWGVPAMSRGCRGMKRWFNDDQKQTTETTQAEKPEETKLEEPTVTSTQD